MSENETGISLEVDDLVMRRLADNYINDNALPITSTYNPR